MGRWHGAHIRYRYMFLKGANTDDEYMTDVYLAPLNDRYDCKVTLNSWGADAEAPSGISKRGCCRG